MRIVALVVFCSLPAFAGSNLTAYDGKLVNDWADFGWSERTLNQGPAKVDVSNFGGWILQHAKTPGDFTAVAFRYKGKNPTLLIELRLEEDGVSFPKVPIVEQYKVKTDGDWSEWKVPFSVLNPEGRQFQKLVFQGKKDARHDPVLIDKIVFLADPSGRQGAPGVAGAPKGKYTTKLSVDCKAKPWPISDQIYGTAVELVEDQLKADWDLGMSARRLGGNLMSRYNWQLGNAYNSGADWFFRNRNYSGEQPKKAHEVFLEEALQHDVKSALVVPLIGWVAKDTESGGFPKKQFPDQEAWDDTFGNGKYMGKDLPPGPPENTSVKAPPSFVQAWIKDIREKDKKSGKRSVHQYILDNEPMLWSTTHRDIHPEHPGYDELLQRTIDYAKVIRKEDPDAVIAGPAEWGWPNYFGSAIDTHTDAFVFKNPDRRKHGGLPLLAWYLKELAAHEKKTKERLLDVLDVHYYPQGKGLGLMQNGLTDAPTSALRIRSTRSLWDPTYKDESWVEDTVKLLPRLQEWIDQYYPGRGISIGEYNFGADWHMSGALAQAETLGRFGQHKVTSAFLWTRPKKNTPQWFAFHAFRNYDGKGARFGDLGLPTSVKDTRPPQPGEQNQVMVSAFASKAGNKLVLVLLNLDPTHSRDATLELKGCGALGATRAFRYDGSADGFQALQTDPAKPELSPWSINVLEVELVGGKPAK